MNSYIYLVLPFLIAAGFAHHEDPYDYHHPEPYPEPPPPPPPLPPYSSERFLDLVRPRGAPVDLVFLIPKGISSIDEIGAARELATKVLTLFNQNNPFVPDGSGLHFSIIQYDGKPRVVLKLSDGTTSAAASSTNKITFDVDTKPDNLAKALHAAYEQFKKYGRPDAKKVLVVFVSSQTTGDVDDVVAKLKALGVEIYVVAVGDDIDEAQILQVVDDAHIIFYEAYARSSNVRFLLSTFVPIPRTRKTKPPPVYPVYPRPYPVPPRY